MASDIAHYEDSDERMGGQGGKLAQAKGSGLGQRPIPD